MVQHDSNALHNTSEENVMANPSMVEELAAAKKEIQELRMKLMWMERTYE